MFTESAFAGYARDLAAANGISLELARQCAARIGDTPLLDDDDRVTVRDASGEVMARLVLPDSRG